MGPENRKDLQGGQVCVCPRTGALNNPYLGAIFIGMKRDDRWELGNFLKAQNLVYQSVTSE